ncbi:hypothetical protein ACI797_08090 [Geodermatophilus sp. SYSU D00691]
MSQPPDDAERTRAMRLPPVPGRRRPDGGTAADQPTDQLPPSPPREPTDRFGPWQPLQPRVVPRRRSRTAVVVPLLALLVVAIGVLAVVLWG